MDLLRVDVLFASDAERCAVEKKAVAEGVKLVGRDTKIGRCLKRVEGTELILAWYFLLPFKEQAAGFLTVLKETASEYDPAMAQAVYVDIGDETVRATHGGTLARVLA